MSALCGLPRLNPTPFCKEAGQPCCQKTVTTPAHGRKPPRHKARPKHTQALCAGISEPFDTILTDTPDLRSAATMSWDQPDGRDAQDRRHTKRAARPDAHRPDLLLRTAQNAGIDLLQPSMERARDMSLGTPIDRVQWDFPEKKAVSGQYVTLQPLSADHLDDLWLCAQSAPDSFTYLRYGPFETRKHLAELIADLSTRKDQPFWAVFGKEGRAEGWLSICDVYQTDGAFEIGSIWFAPTLQGTREAREALFVLMCMGMDDLGYERLVWRCQAQNQSSFRAALNLGFTFEGTWRNAMIHENWQRDIAWFSILRSEWPVCKAAFQKWFLPENFDRFARQKARLQDLRSTAQTP